MNSIYSRAYKEIISKKEMTELEITMAFYFLISYKDYPSHKVQKKLLNIPLHSIKELSNIKSNYYCLHTSRNQIETNKICQDLDNKLTIKQVLKNLNQSVSSENTNLHYKWTSNPPSDILIYYNIDPENHIGFTFQGTFKMIEIFVKFCLRKLHEIDNKLIELQDFTRKINENYSYHSPRGNAVKSSEVSYRICGCYINHNLEEILILNRSSYSSDNWSETYNHLTRETISLNLLNGDNEHKTLADINHFGKNLGKEIILE